MAFFQLISEIGGPKAVKERDSDRTFILIGKGCSGKSTLGNLLIGRKVFETHKEVEAKGLTVEVQQNEVNIDASKVYATGEEELKDIKIQIIDQPGSNDYNFTQENYCGFLKKCIAASKSEMSSTFLILIDLNSSFFSTEEFLTILNLAEVLSDSCYSFFPNAIIVFTHSDKLKEDTDGNLEKILKDKIESEAFSCINHLKQLVDDRYIFINGMDRSELNREEILKVLFELSRPKLQVYINGNNAFRGNELKEFLKEDKEVKSFIKNSLKYDLAYHFNPDLNLFRKLEIQNLEESIAEALEKLSGISKGISAIVLLISLQEVFVKEMYNLILNLPKTYNLGNEFKKDFWEYACIVFKVTNDNRDFVRQNVEGNRLLKTLDIKVKSRYTWVTKKTPAKECSRRITDLVRKVKLDAEGKSYTDNIVLSEMKQTIKESAKLRKDRSKSKIIGDIKNSDLVSEIPFYNLKSDSGAKVASNNFFWDKKTISPLVGYFILKNINTGIAKKFQEAYPGDREIPTDEYTNFCLKEMKTCDY